ncbi:hypothetical protein VTK73DRAFT_4508 [Phialemonium thermophilum]|uniref:Secreted protein n=1 Tax=Phialemonium thermophilum TaxID=223376 RepID=A0ABR3V854_9PEZI
MPRAARALCASFLLMLPRPTMPRTWPRGFAERVAIRRWASLNLSGSQVRAASCERVKLRKTDRIMYRPVSETASSLAPAPLAYQMRRRPRASTSAQLKPAPAEAKMRTEGGRSEMSSSSHWPISPPLWKCGRKMAEKLPYLGSVVACQMRRLGEGPGGRSLLHLFSLRAWIKDARSGASFMTTSNRLQKCSR